MSYDLDFYSKSEDSPRKTGFLSSLVGSRGGQSSGLDENKLLRYLSADGHFAEIEKNKEGFQATYHNKDTEATAFFSYDRRVAGKPKVYPGFRHSGLSLNINYYRPFYYGLEAAQAAEAIGEHFGLYTADPQSKDKAPRKRSAFDIFSVWDNNNTEWIRRQIDTMIRDGHENGETSPDIWSRMARKSSISYWQYLYNQDKIAQYVEAKELVAYTPTWIFVFRRQVDKKLLTCMPVTTGVGYVLPECDLFDVSPDGDSTMSGIVPGEVLFDRLRGLLKPLGMPGLDLWYMDSDRLGEIREVLQSLDLGHKMDGNYQVIRQQNSFVPGVYIDID